MFLSLKTEKLEEHCNVLNQELAELHRLIALFKDQAISTENDALRDLYTKQLRFLNEELEIIQHRKKVLMYTVSVVTETVHDLENASLFANQQLSNLADGFPDNYVR